MTISFLPKVVMAAHQENSTDSSILALDVRDHDYRHYDGSKING